MATYPSDGLIARPAGPWVRDKLGICEAYFSRFTKASKKAKAAFYVDGFAGSGMNRLPWGELVRGTALLGLDAAPPFTKCLMLEEKKVNVDALRARTAHDDRAIVARGDVNLDLIPLIEAFAHPMAPILTVLDQEGLELHWPTVEKLANYRVGRFKTELLILFNAPGLLRLLPLYGPDAVSAAALDAFFGDDRWRAIWERRRSGEIATGEDARTALLALYCQGLRDLGYATVHNRDIRTHGRLGRLRYMLVFATDHPAGEKIMDHCFDQVFPNDFQTYFPGMEPPARRDA